MSINIRTDFMQHAELLWEPCAVYQLADPAGYDPQGLVHAMTCGARGSPPT